MHGESLHHISVIKSTLVLHGNDLLISERHDHLLTIPAGHWLSIEWLRCHPGHHHRATLLVFVVFLRACSAATLRDVSGEAILLPC